MSIALHADSTLKQYLILTKLELLCLLSSISRYKNSLQHILDTNLDGMFLENLYSEKIQSTTCQQLKVWKLAPSLLIINFFYRDFGLMTLVNGYWLRYPPITLRLSTIEKYLNCVYSNCVYHIWARQISPAYSIHSYIVSTWFSGLYMENSLHLTLRGFTA